MSCAEKKQDSRCNRGLALFGSCLTDPEAEANRRPVIFRRVVLQAGRSVSPRPPPGRPKRGRVHHEVGVGVGSERHVDEPPALHKHHAFVVKTYLCLMSSGDIVQYEMEIFTATKTSYASTLPRNVSVEFFRCNYPPRRIPKVCSSQCPFLVPKSTKYNPPAVFYSLFHPVFFQIL